MDWKRLGIRPLKYGALYPQKFEKAITLKMIYPKTVVSYANATYASNILVIWDIYINEESPLSKHFHASGAHTSTNDQRANFFSVNSESISER